MSYSKAGLEVHVGVWNKWNWNMDLLVGGGSNYYYYFGGSVSWALPLTTSCSTAVVWGPMGGGSNVDPQTDRPVDTDENRQISPGREE